jgi:hypothetical protein
LNAATDSINRYEIELDELKKGYQGLLVEAKDRIKHSSHKISSAIEIAQPYYQARLYCQQLSKEVQLISYNYDKAKTHLSAAKEMVYLAEQGLGEKSTLDMACQEMLSHATTRVNQCTNECTEVKNNLKISELKLEVAQNRVLKLQNQLKSAIKASRFKWIYFQFLLIFVVLPYFYFELPLAISFVCEFPFFLLLFLFVFCFFIE